MIAVLPRMDYCRFMYKIILTNLIKSKTGNVGLLISINSNFHIFSYSQVVFKDPIQYILDLGSQS